ncbi:ArsA-related P-loop ATPase [Acidothermaceae bacterium B102]|nr:ArsA-related P-loop ATPase [Acidothermaceae bacterium B102]
MTGKGGTGKTTVSAALALALASQGRSVLLIEVEGRQGIAQVFDMAPLPYEERRIAVVDGGGAVHALAIDPEAALIEYLQIFYNLGRAGAAMRKIGAIDFATTIAPGLRDVLLTGKVKEAVTRRKDGHLVYDAVVMDAPPTGRITKFLNVTSEVQGLAKVGPIHHQAQSVMRLLRSEQTAVHLVTLLEEMPVQETVDGIDELTQAGLQVGGVVVNLVREPLLGPADLAAALDGSFDHAELAADLKGAGLDVTTATIEALVRETAEHAQRITLEDGQRDELAGVGRPMYELPQLNEAIDLGNLRRLAGLLIDQGLA